MEKGQKYPSDLTEKEWEKLKPMLAREEARGRKRRVNIRQVVNGLLYLSRSGG